MKFYMGVWELIFEPHCGTYYTWEPNAIDHWSLYVEMSYYLIFTCNFYIVLKHIRPILYLICTQ